MSRTLPPLDDLLREIWAGWEQSCAQAADPFRTPVFCTAGPHGGAGRVVVLRKVEPARRFLVCYSDLRAAKVRDLETRGHVEWVFYDSARRIQARARGPTHVHHQDDLTRYAWQTLPAIQRSNYCQKLAPGETTADPADLVFSSAQLKNTATGWCNFAMLVTTIEQIDWLKLEEPQNFRAHFSWNGKRFVGAWIVP
jgi:pyridoxamine 5'-phosphate oxidase